MLRPVDVSVMVGAAGGRSARRTPRRLRTLPNVERAWLAAISARATGGRKLIGTLESVSAPPAITTSASPRSIRLTASVIAWQAEAHARLTVAAGVDFARGVASTSSRARLL